MESLVRYQDASGALPPFPDARRHHAHAFHLRYQLGKSLAYDAKDLFVIKNPAEAQLPAPNLSTSYVFATGDSFFAYPNSYNYYVSYYRDTFQHGGISMEEMIIPLITLRGKKR